jgi:hypothetical protein
MPCKKVIFAAIGVVLFASSAVVNRAFADAETKTLLKNVYQQILAAPDCTYGGACGVVFPATTSTTTLIAAVSCSFTIPSGTFVANAFIADSSTGAAFYLQPFIYGTTQDNVIVYGINSTTNLFLKAGGTPYVTIFGYGGAVTGLQCTVSGYQS